MTFRSSVLLLCPAVFLLAQTPPPQSAPATVMPNSSPHVMPPRLTAPPPPPPTVPPDRVVITVGDVKITAAQFDSIISLLPASSQASARGAGRKQFGDAVVRIIALADEGRRRKLDQTPTFQTQIKFAENNLLAGVTAEAMSKEIKLDDADLKKYYDEHLTEFEQAHARHILIRFHGSPSPLPQGRKDLTDAEALAKAQEIRKKLDDGADFAALAKEESYDTGTATNGGDLGPVRHGMMVGPFEQATFALKPGEISQPVKTQFGYHIIKLESKETKTFGEVKPELERRMLPQMTQKAVEELVKQANAVMDPEFFMTAKK
ncbi:MAG TPA: peptidylprolyl isomerase [Bryobacteraceae bacterium]|nr:peptidylprolyl isomerase [Bryobacteraceae bacterium]